MMDSVIGVSFALANSLFRLLSLNFLRPIHLLTFLSVLSIPWLFLFQKKEIKIPKILSFLIIWGLVMALGRYFIIYRDQHYIVSPIFRHFVAFSLGVTFFTSMFAYLKKNSFEKLALSIVQTSIIALAYGLYQKMMGQRWGDFERIHSFYDEPSLYCEYLVLLLVPSLVVCFSNFKIYSKLLKTYILFIAALLFLNLLFAQSGTAVLKILSLGVTCFIFFPTSYRWKLGIAFLTILTGAVVVYLSPGYVLMIVDVGLNIIRNPENFFKYHTYYDRFYPIYPAIKNLFSLQGFFGLGFGGDYFEFRNLFPPSTHTEMMFMKPNFSYFNSYASKVILYFGIWGLGFIIYLFRESMMTKNKYIKIGFFNVLLSALWGVSNLSIPFVWFWFALAKSENEKNP